MHSLSVLHAALSVQPQYQKGRDTEAKFYFVVSGSQRVFLCLPAFCHCCCYLIFNCLIVFHPQFLKMKRTSSQTLALVGSRTQTWLSAAALSWITPWPEITVHVTQISMARAVTWPWETNMAIGCSLDPGYLAGLWQQHGP